MLVRSGAVDVIVIDSVAALTPKAEIEGEMGEPQMGLQARLMSQALRKLTANIKRTNTLVIFINQIRMKIGVMFGNPETTTGGNALKFYASVRMDIRRIGSIKKGDEVIGSETRVKVVKNKVAPPFKQAEFDILYGEGISREGEMLELGVLHGVLEKSGAWYIYNGDRIGQGKDNARDFLKENPELADEIEAKIREKAGVRAPLPVAAARSKTRRGQEGRAPADSQARRRLTRRGTARQLHHAGRDGPGARGAVLREGPRTAASQDAAERRLLRDGQDLARALGAREPGGRRRRAARRLGLSRASRSPTTCARRPRSMRC